MKWTLSLLLTGFAGFIYVQEVPVLKGPYLGQTPPVDSAVIFAPGIISLPERVELGIAFSPDVKECYFVTSGSEGTCIYYTKRDNSEWTEPVIAPFSVNRFTSDPFFSLDGKRLYFNINSSDWSERNIYSIEYTDKGWGEPQKLPPPITTASQEQGYYADIDGVAYIQSNRDNGNWDIWKIYSSPDKKLNIEKLGSEVNSNSMELSPCIAPDGSYLIFSSNRPGSISIQDLYICFDKGNDTWTEPINMEKCNANINIPGYNQTNPYISPDGKYLFYCNHSNTGAPLILDIYWVSTKVIDDIKIEVFNP